jgi:hypothetical protein
LHYKRKVAAKAGPLATVRAWRDDELVGLIHYEIKCRVCKDADIKAWADFRERRRRGEPVGFPWPLHQTWRVTGSHDSALGAWRLHINGSHTT